MSDPKSNRYADLVQIAAGHFAVVYRAMDTLLDRPVALKTLKVGLITEKPQYRAIFARESKFMASLDHPNIVPLYDFFESSQGPVIVMRLVPYTIQSMLAQPSDSLFASILGSARQIASGLDYCSARGIAHRDVKADNVLLDGDQHVYLADFGLAAPFDDHTQWSEPIGARPFISPELFTDRYSAGKAERRERSDEFSFAVLLYHLLTGSLPFASPTSQEPDAGSSWADCTAYRLLSGHHLTPCSERNPQIPARVDTVLSRMLSIDPEDRYPSNKAAVAELDDALSGRGPSTVNLFVSYSRADRALVSQLVEHFQHAGIRVWWDPNIDYGTVWEDEIERAMLESNVMLVVLSDRSADSSEVKNEWRYWLNFLKKPLLTLVQENECRIPYRLFPRQHIYVNSRTVSEVAAELITAIRKAVSIFQAASQASPPEGVSVIPQSNYVLPGLPVLYNLDIGSQMEKLPDQNYVPGNYRLPGLPLDIDLDQFFNRVATPPPSED